MNELWEARILFCADDFEDAERTFDHLLEHLEGLSVTIEVGSLGPVKDDDAG